MKMGFGASKPEHDPDFPPITPILVPRTLRGYPPPRPPSSKQNGAVSSHDFSPIDAMAKTVKVDEKTTYKKLIDELTRDLASDLEKVRAIFTWLGHQHILHDVYPGIADPTLPKGYMKLVKKQLGSYTEFFTLLCRTAGIPCVIVRGRCRNRQYEAGDYIGPCSSSHWSVVHVDGEWSIVHPHWAFSHVTNTDLSYKTLISLSDDDNNDNSNNNSDDNNVDEFFFLPDPQHFRYFCWPEKPEWQLCDIPWTFKEFFQAPFFHSAYFTSGFTLTSVANCVLKTDSGMQTIRFNHNDYRHVKVSYILLVKQAYNGAKLNSAGLENYVCKELGEGHVYIHVRLPVMGVYKIVIYGGLDHKLYPLVDFKIECDEDEFNCPFPIRSSIGVGPGQRAIGCGLHPLSHPNGLVPLESYNQTFDFHHPSPWNIEAILRHHSLSESVLDACVKKVVSRDRVQFHVDFPCVDDEAEEFVLQIYTRVSSDKKALVNILNYLITSCQQLFGDKYKASTISHRLQHGSRGNMMEISLDIEDEYPIMSNRSHLKRTSSTDENENESIEIDLSKARVLRNRRGLERAFNEMLCHGRDLSEFPLETALLMTLYEEEIKDMRCANELEKLMNVIAECNQSVLSERLKDSTTLQRARDFLGRQHRVRQYGAVIQALTRQTVNAIAHRSSPTSIFHDVMGATFLLLGEDEKFLEKWYNIQTLLLMQQEKSIVSRIARFNLDTLDAKVSKRVKKRLEQYNIEEAKTASSGIAAFYLWALGVVKVGD